MRRIAGVYLVAGLCLVGSCADEGDSQEQTLEPTSEETDDGSTTTAKDKATTTTTTEPPAETDLNAVVLQLEEMPTGYAVDASADDETGDDDICGEDPTEDVRRDLSGSDSSQRRRFLRGRRRARGSARDRLGALANRWVAGAPGGLDPNRRPEAFDRCASQTATDRLARV
jgi:hypothetical protein